MDEYRFKSESILKAYTKGMHKKFAPGDVAVLPDARLIWDGKDWVKSGPTISIKNLNASIYAQQPDHNDEQLQEDIELINNYHDESDGHYYMLLCKERSYYTVLVYSPSNAHETLGEAVLACLENIGTIRQVFNNDNADVEIWVNDSNNEIECFHLFKYDIGVVEFY